MAADEVLRSRSRLLGALVLEKILTRQEDPKPGVQEDARNILRKLVAFHQKNENYWRVRDIEEPDPYVLAASHRTPAQAEEIIETTIAEANLTPYEWDIKDNPPVLRDLLTRSEYELFRICIAEACREPLIREHVGAIIQPYKYPASPNLVRNVALGAAVGIAANYADSIHNGEGYTHLVAAAGSVGGACGYYMGKRIHNLKEDLAVSVTASRIEDYVGEAAYELLSTRGVKQA